jgi:hypothetical protein
VKYDDASWHYGGKFPKDLPDEAGGTHTGMFVAWALLAGLAGEIHTNGSPEAIEKLRSRRVTPGQFFFEACDGKFTDEDLSDEGNAFAQEYFDFDRGAYINDYAQLLAKDLPSQYHVRDTWTNFDKLHPVLNKRFHDWRRGRKK